MRGLGSIPTGGNSFSLDFFHIEKLLVTCPQIVMVVNENLVQSKFCVQSTTEKNIVDHHSARMIYFRETSTIRPPNQLITARNEVGARLYFHRRL